MTLELLVPARPARPSAGSVGAVPAGGEKSSLVISTWKLGLARAPSETQLLDTAKRKIAVCQILFSMSLPDSL